MVLYLRNMNVLHLDRTPFIIFFYIIWSDSIGYNLSLVDIPEEHFPYYYSNFDNLHCEKKICPGQNFSNSCWGYENWCLDKNAYHVRPQCPGDHKGWVKEKKAQFETFCTQADFGFVKKQIDELMVLCEPLINADSSLECSQYLRFCRGRNLMLNFTSLVGRGDNLRYKMDILDKGQIGGHCKLYNERLKKEASHMSPLQSWGPEMINFVELDQRPNDGLCDIYVEKPTFIMKLDATVNMYHHFCDFFNLYASLHVNSTHPNMFSKDNYILIWETYTYRSAFGDTWKAFSKHPVWDLKKFRGKVVCFKNVVFPLLPRMIFGLYYNTPLIGGCERSGLFHAFSLHILHSLGIKKEKRKNKKIRITFLSRETSHRRVLNEHKLISALEAKEEYDVRRVAFERNFPFIRQLEIIHNTDILIGIHGAGLTHLLFLPDWAAVFELYNCEDPACYSDLSRLRGLKYVTWEMKEKLMQEDQGHHPDGGSHAKFTNYSFDIEEFLRLVEKAADHVRAHKDFRRFIPTKASEKDEL